MKSTYTSLLLALLFATTFVAVPSCDSGGGSAGTLYELSLYGPPADYPSPFAGLQRIRVSAATQDQGTVSAEFDYAARGGQLPDIPIGDGVQITVEGLAPDNEGRLVTVSRGRTAPLDVDEDAPALLSVFMMKTNSYAPTTSKGVGDATTLVTARAGHSLTLLEDGLALNVGGATLASGGGDPTSPDSLSAILATAEVYDHRSGEFISLSSAGPNASLFSPRAYHRAVRLPTADGPDRVAIFGGFGPENDGVAPLRTVEVYDSVSRTFVSDVPPMNVPRALHTATLLDEQGRVLLVGGYGDASRTWEIWDPAAGVVASGDLQVPRWNHTATLLPDGNPNSPGIVYIFGGESGGGTTNSGELFAVGQRVLISGSLPIPGSGRTLHTANYIAEQNLLYLVGGFSDRAKATPLTNVDVYEVNCPLPPGETLDYCWRDEVPFALAVARGGHETVNMPGNALLIQGGFSNATAADGGVAQVEVIFQSGNQVQMSRTPDLIWPRFGHRSLLLDTGMVLITGGARREGGTTSTIDRGELFNPIL